MTLLVFRSNRIHQILFLTDSLSVVVNGSIGFGIDVFDQLDNAPNKNVFSIELFLDSVLVCMRWNVSILLRPDILTLLWTTMRR